MSTTKQDKLIIRLTPKRHKIVAWALDAMESYWAPGAEEAVDNGHPLGALLPRLDAEALVLDGVHVDVIEDLIYRLDEQYRTMIDDEFEHIAALARHNGVDYIVSALRASIGKES